MRIISDFVDYYDCIQKIAQDRTVIYNRKERTIIDKMVGFPIVPLNLLITESKTLEMIVVYFCGKVYIGCQVYNSKMLGYSYDFKWETISDIDNPNTRKNYRCGLTNHHQWNDYKKRNHGKLVIKPFIEHKTPIIILRQTYNNCNSVTVDGRLNGIGFQSIMDPYSAFQEINMFVSSVLSTGDKNPQWPIPDKLKAQSKGFNDLSFRRQEHPRKSKTTTKKV